MFIKQHDIIKLMLKCQSLEVSLLKQLTSLDDTTIGTPASGDPWFALGPLDVGHGDLGRATMKHDMRGFPKVELGRVGR